MKRRKSTGVVEEPSLPEGFSWGRDINPEAMSYGQIAVDPNGNPKAYLGYMEINHQSKAFQYSLCVGGRTPEARKSYQFLELRAGGLHLSSFLWNNQPFKILENCQVSLPCSTNNTFGVITKTGSDEAMARTLFGATFDELDDFIDHFYTAIRYTPEKIWNWKPARITFSKSRDNNCDLTGVHIPKGFPFIAFTETQYFGGHISLHGFYRHLAFLCHYRRSMDGKIEGEAFFKRLVDSGAKPEVIIQLCEAAFAGYGYPLQDPTAALLRLRC
ncbi:MAG: hypothetical protein LBS59_07035 [Puniceicoccales bacterium]|jgi:hypothetical protein|nr:hypothetical protein [Puniceicoccales bacterium]